MRFTVRVDGPSRGYVMEVYTGHFRLPDLGPIGSNGLANPRDFETPVAAFEQKQENFTIINKFLGRLWSCVQVLARCSSIRLIAVLRTTPRMT
jgi:homogentisate 1,2-dioxygenase